jgi:signal transduction histidine kinase
VPVLALLFVVFATAATEDVTRGPDGQEIIVRSTTGGVPFAVTVAAVALAAMAAVAVWFWSARAVRPMSDIAALADEIQAGSLDRRLDLAPTAREVQQLGDSFDRMLDRLEAASNTQERLIEDTSHELRNPLTALAVNNEVTRNHANPTTEDFMAGLDRSDALIARLERTIDELLSEARTRTQQTRQVDNDLVAIVRRVADQHRTIDPAVDIVVTAPERLLLPIDGSSVERMLTNLIENAARFTPDGMPVEIDVTESPPTLTVTDHGPGIPPEELPHVFDRYYRADHGPGHGIGLAIVKQVADAHGSIQVESPPSNRPTGTRFVMQFTEERGPSR